VVQTSQNNENQLEKISTILQMLLSKTQLIMEKPETNNLFTDLSSEESATINGGHGNCNSSRTSRYSRWNSHHYRSYPRSRGGVNVQVRFNRRFY
jgi:hypothetical protein